MDEIQIYTIGFTQKTARKFFELLKQSGVKRIIDVRLNNVSQLAGFAKRDDLNYFAHEICQIDYVHVPDLAPTQDILDEYKKQNGDWSVYENKFLELMEKRAIEHTLSPALINGGCLLCSEDKPHHCHRRLVAQYLKEKWSAHVEIKHLV
ncbi:MAG TPA: DUF488 domain-containing protein [Opitutaceae bacterium]|nr:DUF488 domain-containing protein [Opitutaceae bacterium]